MIMHYSSGAGKVAQNDSGESQMHRCSHSAALVLSLFLAAAAQAQTNNSYPMLMSVKPAAAQVGQTTEHEVTARYILSGADQVIVSGDGVKAEVVPEEKSDKD